MPRQRRARSPGGPLSPGRSPASSVAGRYLARHPHCEPALGAALQAAVNAKSDDPLGHMGKYLLARSSAGPGAGAEDEDEAGQYLQYSFVAIAQQRTGWLAAFLVGLLCCSTVMKSFERLLSEQVTLAFFVPLLIGHGGNSGGQTVSTVIRALGSGAIKLEDAPRVVAKEAAAGVLQSLLVVLALYPYLRFVMETDEDVSVVVALTMPVLGFCANGIGASLPFLVTWLGKDPAVIAGPLMTTSVDTIGLTSYLTIASAYLGLGTAATATAASSWW